MKIEEAIKVMTYWKDTINASNCDTEPDRFAVAIETLLNEYEKQQDRINKTIEYIESQEFEHDLDIDYERCKNELLKVLKGE